MKIARQFVCVAVASLLLQAGAHADSFLSKSVGLLQASGDVADCFYFTLDGVTQPGPVSAGPYFAVRRTDYGAKEAYATLLAAKLSGHLVSVQTHSSISAPITGCGGYVIAKAVWIGSEQ